MNTKRIPVADRLKSKLVVKDGCLLFTGYRMTTGYGQISRGGQGNGMALAHRMAWELEHGPIPKGMQIDHLCRVRACCNTDHMELVTPAENTRRGAGPGHALWIPPTHCNQGHEYTKENTIRRADGGRRCHTCQLKYMREYKREYRKRPGVNG